MQVNSDYVAKCGMTHTHRIFYKISWYCWEYACYTEWPLDRLQYVVKASVSTEYSKRAELRSGRVAYSWISFSPLYRYNDDNVRLRERQNMRISTTLPCIILLLWIHRHLTILLSVQCFHTKEYRAFVLARKIDDASMLCNKHISIYQIHYTISTCMLVRSCWAAGCTHRLPKSKELDSRFNQRPTNVTPVFSTQQIHGYCVSAQCHVF